jgi:hypothetical protein
VLTTASPFFGWAFVAARDGVEVEYRGRVAYATRDDLLKLRAYDLWLPFRESELRFAVAREPLLVHLGQEIGATPVELEKAGRFRRLVMRRRGAPDESPIVNRSTLRAAAIAAGRYLARAVKDDGSYRYEVEAVSGAESGDYNWPRHAGATWYLADVASYAKDPELIEGAVRAAERLIEHALVHCGKHRCIAEGDRADLGSSALALLAFVEIFEAGFMPELERPIVYLLKFLLSMQRPDGEFLHFYDRFESKPLVEQVLYSTGEATLALERASRVTGNQKAHDAARRALEHLVNPPFWYVGWRYFWGSEHWTCHSMNALFSRAPNRGALRFCLDWQESVRNLAIRDRAAAPAFDGATSGGPFVMPQLVGTASRMEAAVSTLDAALRAGIDPGEIERLEAGIRESLGFLMRFQLRPGPAHLMPDPKAMHGGFPATPTDLHVRIDYPQHAGTALLHFLRILEREGRD